MNRGPLDDLTTVVGVGWALMDTTMEISGFPAENSKVVATRVRENPGGPALRALVALSRLGHRTSLVSSVGSDDAGSAIVRYLTEQGVHTDFVTALEGSSRQASVWLNRRSGSRTIAFADQLPPASHLPQSAVDAATAVVLDGREYLVARAALEAAPLCALRSIDTGGSPKENLSDLVNLCDCVVLPKGMLDLLCAKADRSTPRKYVETLLSNKASLVVVTGTTVGAIAFSDDEAWIQPNFEVPTIDSNGAGDSFHAGLVHARLLGLTPEDATRVAAAVAAMKCTGNADVRLPTQEELSAFLRLHASEAEPVPYSKTDGEL